MQLNYFYMWQITLRFEAHYIRNNTDKVYNYPCRGNIEQRTAQWSRSRERNKYLRLWSNREWVTKAARNFTLLCVTWKCNKLLLQPWKHSKYMYARCLNCLFFINCLLALIKAPKKVFDQVKPGIGCSII